MSTVLRRESAGSGSGWRNSRPGGWKSPVDCHLGWMVSGGGEGPRRVSGSSLRVHAVLQGSVWGSTPCLWIQFEGPRRVSGSSSMVHAVLQGSVRGSTPCLRVQFEGFTMCFRAQFEGPRRASGSSLRDSRCVSGPSLRVHAVFQDSVRGCLREQPPAWVPPLFLPRGGEDCPHVGRTGHPHRQLPTRLGGDTRLQTHVVS